MTRNLFTRDDTFFGICEALGEDFGFHANILRMSLAIAAYFNPVAVVGAYLGAGVLVMISRWIAPNPKAVVAAEPEAVHVRAAADNENVGGQIPLAA